MPPIRFAVFFHRLQEFDGTAIARLQEVRHHYCLPPRSRIATDRSPPVFSRALHSLFRARGTSYSIPALRFIINILCVVEVLRALYLT